MIKHLLLAIIASLCFSLNAEALIRQSASKALSYNNTFVNKKASVEVSRAREEAPALAVAERALVAVDLSSAYNKTLSAKINDDVVLTLTDKANYSWNIAYDSDCFTMIGNTITADGLRKVTLRPKASCSGSQVYFKQLNADGDEVASKLATVSVSK